MQQDTLPRQGPAVVAVCRQRLQEAGIALPAWQLHITLSDSSLIPSAKLCKTGYQEFAEQGYKIKEQNKNSRLQLLLWFLCSFILPQHCFSKYSSPKYTLFKINT